MVSEEKKIWAAQLLIEKQENVNRLPKKEDFDPITRSRIKAFLGPWPRALEAAGLKKVSKKTQKQGSQKRKGAVK